MSSGEEIKKEKNSWRELGRGRRFVNAFRGICIFFKTTRHFLTVHLPVSVVVVVLGFYFRISSFEWIALVFSIGLVIISEVFNTAIEIDIDLTSPEYHPFARDTKDVAAAAVAISSIVAIIVGLIVFLPKVLWYDIKI